MNKQVYRSSYWCCQT